MQKLFTTLSLLFAVITINSQAVFNSAGSGSWDVPGTWTVSTGSDEDGIPDSNDNVNIGSHTITLSANASCNLLSFNLPNGNRLSLGSNTLEVNGSIDFIVAPTVENYISSTVGTGRVKFVGSTSRSLFLNNGAAFGREYELEIDAPGATISNSSNVKFRALYITNGTLSIANSVRIDGGTDGNTNGKLIIGPNGTLSATASGSIIGARTGTSTTYCGSILVDGTLETSGTRINGQDITINGSLVLKNSNALVSDPSSLTSPEFTYGSNASVKYNASGNGNFGAETGRASSITDPILPTIVVNVGNELKTNSKPAKTKNLDFISGKVNIQNVDFTIVSDGTISGYGPSNYILANSFSTELIREGVGGVNTIFPIGTASNYLPLEINNGGTVDAFRAFVSDMSPNSDCMTAATSATHTWTLNEVNSGGSNCIIALTRVNVGAQYDPATAKIVHCPTSGGPFDYANGSGETNNRVEGSGFTTFSPFGIGSTASPLPVILSNFDGVIQDKVAHLYFTTLSEKDMDRFIIERSLDSKRWITVGEIKALGQSYTENNYTFIDKTSTVGRFYYRLKMVDYDGLFSYSDIITLYQSLADISVQLDVMEDEIKVSGLPNQYYSVSILDFNGRKVASFDELSGDNNLSTTDLLPGMYIIQVLHGSNYENIKFIRP